MGMWHPLVMFKKSDAGILKILIFRPKIGHFVSILGQKLRKWPFFSNSWHKYAKFEPTTRP